MTNSFKKVAIGSVTTVGEELMRARAMHNISREAVAQELAIPVRYLEALESGNYRNLPGAIYIRGWLKKYAGALNLSVPDILRRYSREASLTEDISQGRPKRRRGALLGAYLSRVLTAITLRRLSLSLTVLVAIGYIGFIIYQGVKAPTVVLAEGFVDRQTHEDTITVQGTADVGVELTVNEQPIELDGSGAFTEQVGLIDGINTITVEAKRPHSRLFTKTMTIVKTQEPSLEHNGALTN